MLVLWRPPPPPRRATEQRPELRINCRPELNSGSPGELRVICEKRERERERERYTIYTMLFEALNTLSTAD